MKTSFKPGVPINTNYAITLGRKLERMLTDIGVTCEYNESCFDGIRIKEYRNDEGVRNKVNTIINVDSSKVKPSKAIFNAIIIQIDGIVLNTLIEAEV